MATHQPGLLPTLPRRHPTAYGAPLREAPAARQLVDSFHLPVTTANLPYQRVPARGLCAGHKNYPVVASGNR